MHGKEDLTYLFFCLIVRFMSVQLTSPNGYEESTSNGQWLAMTSLAEAFGENVPQWNGHHDEVIYTPEQLRAMATRIEQLDGSPEWLRALADAGGATLS